jgi:hypothetical protein
MPLDPLRSRTSLSRGSAGQSDPDPALRSDFHGPLGYFCVRQFGHLLFVIKKLAISGDLAKLTRTVLFAEVAQGRTAQFKDPFEGIRGLDVLRCLP